MKSYNEMIEEWRSLLGGRDKDPESQDMYAWTKSVEKNSMTEVQTKIHGKVSTEAYFSWREGELNIMDIFKVALDKLNSGGKTSFNIVN